MKEVQDQPLAGSVLNRRSPKVRRQWPRRKDFCACSVRRSLEICVGTPVFVGIFFWPISQRRVLGAAGWRREWDSNPRYGFPYTRFPSVRLKPLGHPSGTETSMENRKGNIAAGFRVTTRRVMRCGARRRVGSRGRWPPALRHSAAMKDRGTPLDLSWWTPVAKHGAEPIRTLFVISADLEEVKQEDVMGRGLLYGSSVFRSRSSF